jgi:hypothetical protein
MAPAVMRRRPVRAQWPGEVRRACPPSPKFQSAMRQSSEQPLEQSDYQKQDHCTESRGHNGADHASAQSEAEPQSREQQSRNKGAGDADDYVAKQAEACALNQNSGKPTGDRTDNQGNDNCHDIHDVPLERFVSLSIYPLRIRRTVLET